MSFSEKEKRAGKKFLKCFKDDKNICWEWEGAKDKQGYGVVSINEKQYRAHRLCYILVIGPIPKNKVIMHKCDNPLCVNPYHLQLGTQKENTQDCMKKGRRGKVGRKFKFTQKDLQHIKELATSMTRKEISILFTVSVTTVAKILNNKY